MNPLRHILVAIKDLQGKTQPALQKAIQLARGSGASLEIYHALNQPLYFSVFGPAKALRDTESDVRADALRQLEKLAAQARRHRIEVTIAVDWDFPVYEAVIRRARHIGADLIVCARHEGRRLLPSLMQLADWELLRWSSVPVLLVQDTVPYRRPAVLAAVDPGHAFSKPARLDTRILSVADSIASALKGRLHAMHAFVPLAPEEISLGFPDAAAARRAVKEKLAAAEAALDKVLDKFDVPKSRRHLSPRHPVDAIPAVARKTKSSIVVMGAVSRTGVRRLFIGNTAETVLRDLKCDLLIVKPEHFKCPVARRSQGPQLVPIDAVVSP
jgi:universal stress protein E